LKKVAWGQVGELQDYVNFWFFFADGSNL